MTQLVLGLVLLAGASRAAAQLSIEITGPGVQRTPIAIVPFVGENTVGTSLTGIVRADLERSGLFRGLEIPPLSPHPNENSPVNYGEWRSRLADALVVGSVAQNADGRFEVRFRVYDVVKQAPLGAIAYLFTKENARAAAHRIADFVYEKLTGEKGVFSTQIAYVVKRGPNYELQIADADGERPVLLRSNEPIISRSGRPTGASLRLVRGEEAHRLCAPPEREQAPGGGELQGLQLRARLVPGRQDDRGRALGRGRLADFPHQRGRQLATPAHQQLQLDRHRAALLDRREVALLHVRPRRQPADLPHARHRRRAAARNVQGQL
jgi:hypothetical protein